MQRVAHRRTGIYSLPVELLTRLFILGAGYEYPYSDSPYLLKANQPYFTTSTSNFQLLVSQVCRHWRTIALRTSCLWTTLHFREPSHLPRAEAYLARCSKSGPHLLDILVDTVAFEDHIPGVTLCREEIIEIFKLIIPHVKRWRSFHLKICDNDCKGAARHYLSTCGPAPYLETLQLYHFEDFRTSANLYLATYRPPVVVFDSCLPRLKNVSLIGVNLPWTNSPFLEGLHNLELALHSENTRPLYETWDHILRRSPELSKLSLHYSGPRLANGDEELEWPTSKERISVKSIRDLCLTDLDCDYLCLVMERLVLPGVKRLSLCLPDQDCTAFIQLITSLDDEGSKDSNEDEWSNGAASASSSPDTLVSYPTTDMASYAAHTPSSPVRDPAASADSPSSTVSPSQPACLTHSPLPFIRTLETLVITALECDVSSWRNLLRALEGLCQIEIDFAKVGDGLFWVLTEGYDVVIDSNMQSTKTDATKSCARHLPFLPRLDTFKVSGLSGEKVGALIQYREGLGLPIACLPMFKDVGRFFEGTYRVENWIVQWSERWRGKDPILDDLVENGWHAHGKDVRVLWFEPEDEEDEEADSEMDEIYAREYVETDDGDVLDSAAVNSESDGLDSETDWDADHDAYVGWHP